MAGEFSPMKRVRLACLSALFGVVLLPMAAEAQNTLGGHFGVVIPMVTHVDSRTTTVADDFVIGFPTGITVKRPGKLAFDLEFVPVIQNDPLGVSLTVHPGVIYALPQQFALGLRMAFDVNKASWGFTPLVNRSFRLAQGCSFFAEMVVPIRFQENNRVDETAVGLGIHLGVGF